MKLIKVQGETGTPIEVIDFEYFNKVMKIIKTNLLKIEAQSKEEYTNRRISLYKEQRWDAYEAAVKENYVQTQNKVA